MKVRLFILFSLHFVMSARDFYVGMFKKDDLLVASDTLYKDRIPYRTTMAKYGRLFKCDITYFRVVDRLGVGRVPKVEITRGGLRKKYLVLRITSGYNLPLSVNIYVGCENKYNFTRSTYIKRRTVTTPMRNNTKGTTKKATTKKVAQNGKTTTAHPKAEKKDEDKEKKKEEEKKEDEKKEEEKKEEGKKEDEKKEDGKKVEGKKEDEKKEDGKKEDGKKEDGKKEDEKKGDDKKEEKKDGDAKADEKKKDGEKADEAKPEGGDDAKVDGEPTTVKTAGDDGAT